jgi:hypothetical protein
LTRHIPRPAAVGFLAIAALLAFTAPGASQDPSPAPNADGWHNEPFTVTFSREGMTCAPPETSYPAPGDDTPDDPSPAPLTSVCSDGQEPPSTVTLTYDFQYDATDPTANPVPRRTPDHNGWYNHAVIVDLNWNAAVSGAASDPGNCPPDLTYSGGNVTSTCSDRAGNQGSESINLQYDDVPPTVDITAGPADGGVSGDRTPSLSFSANEQGSTFKCMLDTQVYDLCQSPWQPPIPLGDGSHTFSVSATDRAGNPSAFLTRTWEVAQLPSSGVSPVIVGAAAEAETLSTDANATQWTGTPPIQLTIQWQRCDAGGGGCEGIGGATGSDYVVQPADVGQRIRVQVRASNIAGFVEVNSAQTDVVVALDRTLPQTTIIRQPPNPTNRRTATFTFEASRAGSTFECKLNAGAFAACVSPKTYSGLAARTHTFRVRAMFTARNNELFVEDTPAAAIWRIDALRPPAPGFVRVRAGDQRLSLTWTVARVADIRGTRVVRSRVRRPNTLVLRLLARSRLSDGGLRNGALYRYVLRTVDRAGNLSLAKVVYGRPRDPLLAPRDGAVVARPPLLRWLARPHATYYNLQLYRVRPGTDLKMLSTWPIRPSYQVRQRWRFGGLRILRRGMYRWYVWPGFGSFAEERFGRLMGTSVFTKS